uniref:Uncharacterized protein n=1 Tax=Aegilops tauschii subsp. strangulata TaxID=200361 RepID=A0A453A338_AEGTS
PFPGSRPDRRETSSDSAAGPPSCRVRNGGNGGEIAREEVSQGLGGLAFSLAKPLRRKVRALLFGARATDCASSAR